MKSKYDVLNESSVYSVQASYDYAIMKRCGRCFSYSTCCCCCCFVIFIFQRALSCLFVSFFVLFCDSVSFNN